MQTAIATTKRHVSRGQLLRTTLRAVSLLARDRLTAAQLSDCLSVSLRTAYRIVEQLRDGGIKVNSKVIATDAPGPPPSEFWITKRVFDRLLRS